jgi:hypothetical protein
MKNKIIIRFTALLMFGSMLLPSCVDDFRVGDDFLEKQPGVDVNQDTVFSRAEYARYFLWDTYMYMYHPFADGTWAMNANIFETLSDCWHSVLGWDDHARIYYPGVYNAGNESGWIQGRFSYLDSQVWPALRSAWIFIENVDRVPDMDETEKERLKAEAKIIIASRYFDLMRHVGGLPIVDHAYAADEAFETPRATIEETVNFIISLLDEAAATSSLPWNIPDREIETWFGRLTKGAALGLKAKVLLFAASPIFNDTQAYTNEAPQTAVELKQVWYGGKKQELWEQCRQACEAFFSENARNGDYYQLVQPTAQNEAGYTAAYRKAYWTRGNSEKVISTIKVFKLQEWDQFIGNTSHNGATAPTLEFMEMFPWSDGRNFDATAIYNTDNPGDVDIFKGRDPRLYETLLVQKEGFTWQGVPIEMWRGGASTSAWFWGNGFAAHGLALYKWILDYWHIGDEPVQWPYLRMAEVHLIYAEALAETGDLLKALIEVNKVRNRVGLPNIETANPGLGLITNKEALITEIIRERACELGMEDTRLHDMVRRKLASDFTKPLHGIRILRKDGIDEAQGTGPYPKFKYEKYAIENQARAWWIPGFWTNKWFLSAMPVTEINKDYGLTQNPGW